MIQMIDNYRKKREIREILRLKTMLHEVMEEDTKKDIERQILICELLSWRDYKFFCKCIDNNTK